MVRVATVRDAKSQSYMLPEVGLLAQLDVNGWGLVFMEGRKS